MFAQPIPSPFLQLEKICGGQKRGDAREEREADEKSTVRDVFQTTPLRVPMAVVASDMLFIFWALVTLELWLQNLPSRRSSAREE